MPRDQIDYITKQMALLLYCCDLPRARWHDIFLQAAQIAEAWEQEDQALHEEEECICE